MSAYDVSKKHCPSNQLAHIDCSVPSHLDSTMDLNVLAAGFRQLASRFRDVGVDSMRAVHLQEEAGGLLLTAFREGCLKSETVDALVDWFNGADHPDLPPNFVRCPFNVWLVAIGTVLPEIKPGLITFGRSLEYYVNQKDRGHLADHAFQQIRHSILACEFFSNLFAARRPFVFSRLQEDIWTALYRRSLKKDQLAAEVCGGDGSRLYRKNGLKEMRNAGCVCHAPGLGYFRPDAPPSDGHSQRTR